MEERIPMNTKSLQKHFRAEYEEFFSKNDLIVSGCFTGSLAPTGMGHRSKAMRIKFKLPRKMYLGINVNQTGKINFEKIFAYHNAGNHFLYSEFHETIDRKESIMEFVKNFLKANNKEQGIDVNILSEGARGYSLGFSANFAAVLTVALYIFIGKITHKDLEKYDEFAKSDIFHEIEVTSRQIELLGSYGNAAGETMYTLYKSHMPALFYCEEFDANINIERIKDIKYSFTPFTKLFNIQEDNYYPFDYATVFSGLPSNTKKVEHTMQLDEKKLQKYVEFIDNKVIPITKIKKDIPFIKTLHDGIYTQFVNIFSVSLVIILKSLEKLYTEGGDTRNIQYLIDAINSTRYLFYMLEENPSDFIETFTSLFHEESKNKDKIGIVHCYSGKPGGSYIVIMKHGTNRNHFLETMKKLKSDYPDMQLNYASWVDGVVNDGVQLEQYISTGIFSQYIQKDKVYIRNSIGSNYMEEYNKVLSTHQEGLLLDTIKNKIYLNGKKLNSGDIPSQTTTINVIDKLLDNIGKDISNNKFDISSYSKNKNEMLGKIVLPLVSLLERETGQRLPLICKGSIYDFYVKLNASDIQISIIKKI